MTQYNSLIVKLSNSLLNKLNLAIKNEADVVLKLSSNMIGNSDDETNFPHKLFLTNRQVANLCKDFASHTSPYIQSGEFLRKLLPPLPKTRLSLIKNVMKPLAKSCLVPLGLTAAASAADAGTHKKS